MLLVIFITCVLIVIAVITLSNVFMFPRLNRVSELPRRKPLVSVLIPARNEAAVIGTTVRHLLAQDYHDFEVILLDDHSTDDTGELARAAAEGDERLTVMSGKPLPKGWLGKNWACDQMSRAASGDIFIFTDADVRWMPGALTALVSEMVSTDADLYTVWPTQITETWPERLVVPLMAVVVLGYLPVFGAHRTPFSAFAAANGQCMAWRRDAYDITGGHAAVYNNVLEDVTLARIVKRRGLRLRMEDGGGLIVCRMYNGWSSVRDGYAKNILAGYGGSVLLLLLATVFHWLIFLFPWAWLILGWAFPALDGWPLWPLMLVAIGLLVRALTAAFTRQRIQDASGMPISVLLMTIIAFRAIRWHWSGGPQWKGRTITTSTENGEQASKVSS